MTMSLPFEKLNETDIREEIIAPLIRRLGYRSGTDDNVIREQILRYPKLTLGRKTPKKDPFLRGRADYILEAKQRVRWVIEAKAPEVSIGIDDVEQAWTYANHQEVRAVYFVLCNGRIFNVYRTAYSPDSPPVLSLLYEELDSQYQTISNALGPDALLRDFPEIKIDFGVPIAPGLRSIARITNGLIRYENNSLNLSVLSELQNGVQEGAIERDANGCLVAFLRTTGPSRSLHELNERLGLGEFEMTSSDNVISTNPAKPTIFGFDKQVILPAGEKLLDMNTWQHITIPVNITCHVSIEAIGTMIKNTFSGKFLTCMKYPGAGMEVKLLGSFDIHLA
ncbi:MAG: hypothetical protein V4495_17775 [Pseudomonadota bacterium]